MYLHRYNTKFLVHSISIYTSVANRLLLFTQQQDQVEHFILSGTLKTNKNSFPQCTAPIIDTNDNNSGMKWLMCILLLCHTQLFLQEHKYFWLSLPGGNCWGWPMSQKQLRILKIDKKKLSEFCGFSFWLFLNYKQSCTL